MGLFEQVRPSQRPLAGRYELLGNASHRALAREAARKSLVLLKNNQQLLPLRAGSRVLVAGDGADNIGKQSGGWTLSWQGSGNSNHDFPNGESIYAGIQHAVQAGGGSTELSENGRFSIKPDVAIVVFGEEPYAEFIGDRSHLAFDDNRALQILKQLKAQGIPTVSVFLSGRPLWVNPELNQSDAFVAAFLPGTEGGAVADVLFRAADGSVRHDFQGRLSFSWPDNAKGEPLNVGDANYNPLFAYGYGLSYRDNTVLAPLHENAGISAAAMLNTSRYLYAGKAVTPWQLQLSDAGTITVVADAQQRSAAGAVTAIATDRLQQEDSVTLRFDKAATVRLGHADGIALDLARQSNGDMALELEYQVVSVAAGTKVELGMQCGDNCASMLDISSNLQAMQGKGWHSTKIALRCFSQANSNFDISRVTQPMVLRSDAGLVLQLANVRLAQNEGNATCGN